MKKILLCFPILLLCHSLHAQSLREQVLSADVVVVAELVWVNDRPTRSYASELTHKLIVRKYLKGSGVDTLCVMMRGTFVLPIRLFDDTPPREMVYTLMEMKNDTYLLNNELDVSVAPLVAEILALPEVDSKQAFGKTVAWMVSSYLKANDIENDNLFFELGDYDMFVTYSQERGYIEQPIDALSSKQRKQLITSLMKKDHWWDSDDTYFANLLVDELPKKEAAQHILNMLEDLRLHPSYKMQSYFDILARLLPNLPIDDYTVHDYKQHCLYLQMAERIDTLTEIIRNWTDNK